MHIASRYVAWSNGFRITGTQLALAMQMVECSLAHCCLVRRPEGSRAATHAMDCLVRSERRGTRWSYRCGSCPLLSVRPYAAHFAPVDTCAPSSDALPRVDLTALCSSRPHDLAREPTPVPRLSVLGRPRPRMEAAIGRPKPSSRRHIETRRVRDRLVFRTSPRGRRARISSQPAALRAGIHDSLKPRKTIARVRGEPRARAGSVLPEALRGPFSGTLIPRRHEQARAEACSPHTSRRARVTHAHSWARSPG